MKRTTFYNFAGFLLLALMVTACGPSQKVSRVSTDTNTDLSGKWNDTDARKVAGTMIDQVTTAAWLRRFRDANGRDPVLIVGRVRNESMEHIDTEVFTKELERALVNSGEVTFVASSSERAAIREERKEQQEFASFESAKALAKELGADYMIIGNLNSIMDQAIDQKTIAVFYTVNLELIDIETNAKAWIGNEKIKKIIERSRWR